MHERLRNLLPLEVARTLWDPALADMRLTRLRAGAGAVPRARMLLLWLDCWRVALMNHGDYFGKWEPAAVQGEARMTAFGTDLKQSLRRLRRDPGFTAAALITLALGAGGSGGGFTVVEAVLLRPLPYEQSDRLAIVEHRNENTGLTKPFITMGDWMDMHARQRVFDGLATYGSGETTLELDGEPVTLGILSAGPGLMEVLRMRPLMGRTFTAADSRPGAEPVVILGHALWQSRFEGASDIVGRTLRVGPRERTIVGVAPAGFRFPPDADNDLILPMQLPLETPAQRTAGWVFAVGRLAEGRDVQAADAHLLDLSRAMAAEHPVENDGSVYYAVPLRDALVGSTRNALLLLLAAVSVVLLIACVNMANLQLARSLGRQREFAVRLALGARRSQLASMLLAESLVLSCIAGAVGVVLALWGARALVAFIPESVRVGGLDSLGLNARVLGFALLLVLATTLAFGGVAALMARVRHQTLASSRGGSPARGARRAASALVVAEVALAVVLLMGAGVVVRSFARLMTLDPGFRYENVLTVAIQLPAARYDTVTEQRAFYSRAMAELRTLPGVREVGAGAIVPLTGNVWTAPLDRADRPTPAGERPPEVGWASATGSYFRALDIPLVAGRLFDEHDVEGPLRVIVSEAVQEQFFPGESAVGRQLRFDDELAEIVGVVGDIRRAGLREAPRPDMYFSYEQNATSQTNLFIRSAGDPADLVTAVRERLRALDPQVAIQQVRTLRDIATESVRVTQLMLRLLGLFAVMALILAAVGMYGVLSYSVRQRYREIGTRMAVGATRRDILILVVRNGTLLAAAGMSIGVGIGLAANRLLQSALYEVGPGDPVTALGAVMVLAAVSVAASWMPARRAASVDPASTLGQ